MINDELKPSWEVALGAAVVATAAALLLAALTNPQGTWWTFAQWGTLVFCLVWGLAMGYPIGVHVAIAVKVGELERARMSAEIAKHKLALAQFNHEADTVGHPSIVPGDVVDNVPRYAAEWRKYWMAALEYAQSVGSLSFNKNREFFNDNLDVWRECVAYPFVRAGMFEPVKERKETAPADGWTIDKIKERVEAGVGPAPLPYPPPER